MLKFCKTHMEFNPFYILLALLIFIPQILGLMYIPFKVLVVILTLFMFISFDLKTFKENKWFRYNLLGIALIFIIFEWIKNFSLNNLPFLLFLISDWFIIFLSFKKDTFRKFLYLSLLSFLNTALISVKFNTLLYGIILFFYLFLEEYFFLLLTAEVYRTNDRKLFKELLKYSVISYTLVLLLGGVLFIILPRPQYPLFALLQRDTENPIVGFSSDIKLGAFAKISTDNSIVFRAKVKSLNLNKTIYWRGNTLEIYLNNVWYSTNLIYASVEKWEGKPYKEETLVSPYGGKNIFSYGYPYKILKTSSPVKIVNYKGVIIAKNFLITPLRTEFLTYPSQKVRLINRKLLLKYPKKLEPIFEEIVKKYDLKGKSFAWTLKGIGKFFSQFKYSLSNKANNLFEFLKIYKEGNCEYFASATALLFRYLGYPTRVVVGFLGGEYNPITGYWVVRQKDAHAWVEVYFKHRWFRFDATNYAISGNSQKQAAVKTKKISKLEKNRLMLIWDTLNTYWLNYVVNLNREKQKEIISNTVKFFKKVKINLDKEKIFTFLLILFLVISFLFWKKILLYFYSLLLIKRYRIPFKFFNSFVDLYNYLWKYYPSVWKKEKNRLKKLIGITNFKVLSKA
jgi:hypothetical protein